MNLKTISEDTYKNTEKDMYVFLQLKSMDQRAECRIKLLWNLKKEKLSFLSNVQIQKVVDFKVISCSQVLSFNTVEIKGLK